MVEGTHFSPSWTSFRDIGWKACAVNLSDIAAMGGRPRHIVVALTIPTDFKRVDLRDFYRALVECAQTYRAQVVGGDLTRGPAFIINVTVLGHVHENGCLTRTGARCGDVVVATGDFGASAAGLWLLQQGCDTPTRKQYSYCLERHEHPLPRLCESWALVRNTGNRGALMDTSDGLADALVQVARQSKVAMDIDYEAVPVHEQTREIARQAGVSLDDWVLYGGEDYELVGTLSPQVWQKLQDQPDNPFVCIGKVTTGAGVKVRSHDRGDLTIDLSKCFQQVSEKLREQT